MEYEIAKDERGFAYLKRKAEPIVEKEQIKISVPELKPIEEKKGKRR